MLVDNEVLLLQAELEGIHTCLENFGLPTPKKSKRRIQKIPQVIRDEMFDTIAQKNICIEKCRDFNAEQQDAFCLVMKAVSVMMSHRDFSS